MKKKCAITMVIDLNISYLTAASYKRLAVYNTRPYYMAKILRKF